MSWQAVPSKERKLASANGQSVQQFSAWCNTTEKSVCWCAPLQFSCSGHITLWISSKERNHVWQAKQNPCKCAPNTMVQSLEKWQRTVGSQIYVMHSCIKQSSVRTNRSGVAVAHLCKLHRTKVKFCCSGHGSKYVRLHQVQQYQPLTWEGQSRQLRLLSVLQVDAI